MAALCVLVSSTSVPAYAAQYVAVKKKSATIYSRATKRSRVIARRAKGTRLKVIGRAGRWLNVVTKGKSGWVHISKVRRWRKKKAAPTLEPLEEEQQFTHIRVVVPRVNVRTGRGSRFRVIARPRRNTDLYWRETRGKWYKVELPKSGKTGWVFGRGVQPIVKAESVVPKGDLATMPDTIEEKVSQPQNVKPLEEKYAMSGRYKMQWEAALGFTYTSITSDLDPAATVNDKNLSASGIIGYGLHAQGYPLRNIGFRVRYSTIPVEYAGAGATTATASFTDLFAGIGYRYPMSKNSLDIRLFLGYKVFDVGATVNPLVVTNSKYTGISFRLGAEKWFSTRFMAYLDVLASPLLTLEETPQTHGDPSTFYLGGEAGFEWLPMSWMGIRVSAEYQRFSTTFTGTGTSGQNAGLSSDSLFTIWGRFVIRFKGFSLR
jgi:uncharacterized protein YgiM (DUF1202 family)